MLHGEQYLELFRPLPTDGNLKTECRVVDVVDKGKGALIVIDGEILQFYSLIEIPAESLTILPFLADTFDENGEKIAFNQTITFVVGAGNFNGKKQSEKIKPVLEPPSRAPDNSFVDKTLIDQVSLSKISSINKSGTFFAAFLKLFRMYF